LSHNVIESFDSNVTSISTLGVACIVKTASHTKGSVDGFSLSVLLTIPSYLRETSELKVF
jgi:hypothetical protein